MFADIKRSLRLFVFLMVSLAYHVDAVSESLFRFDLPYKSLKGMCRFTLPSQDYH